MMVMISASVAGSNRLKDAVGGKVVSLWSIEGRSQIA